MHFLKLFVFTLADFINVMLKMAILVFIVSALLFANSWMPIVGDVLQQVWYAITHASP